MYESTDIPDINELPDIDSPKLKQKEIKVRPPRRRRSIKLNRKTKVIGILALYVISYFVPYGYIFRIGVFLFILYHILRRYIK